MSTHFAPHPSANFEGYYSRFTLPSGATLILIICSVPDAKERPHKVSCHYYNPKSPHSSFLSETWPSNINHVRTSIANPAFSLDVEDVGNFRCYPGEGASTKNDGTLDEVTEYNLSCDAVAFTASTSNRKPWDPRASDGGTPAGLLAYLPLPLHWHVQTLSSPAPFTLEIPGFDLPAEDREGVARVHQEKNWADSFPTKHMWISAVDEESGAWVCGAGGEVLGLEAWCLGFSSGRTQLASNAADKKSTEKAVNLSFTPPTALRIPFLRLSLGLRTAVSWVERSFSLTISGWTRKIELLASAPRGSFIGLSAPFKEGHRKNFLAQSFLANIHVQVSERRWWIIGPWEKKLEKTFERASLEFGGGYYGARASAERFH